MALLMTIKSRPATHRHTVEHGNDDRNGGDLSEERLKTQHKFNCRLGKSLPQRHHIEKHTNAKTDPSVSRSNSCDPTTWDHVRSFVRVEIYRREIPLSTSR